MKISASSFETAKDLCMRKWAMKELWDMPEAPNTKDGTDFGAVIHGVNERWLLADDRGNGPELYPDGWSMGLNEADAALVKMLHEKAVETGVLVRRKGRKPEEWMNTPIIVDNDVVQLTGKLDVMDPTGFEDHKSSKAKKWTKDEAGLASDAAMLFYAVEWCKRHADAIQVRMRYNYFLKDKSKPETWSVEVVLKREVVEHFKHTQLMPTVRAMVACAKANIPEEKWSLVEGPKSSDACRAFGGCAFATICGGVESPAQYRARIQRVIENQPTSPTQPMGFFSKKPAASPAVPDPATPATPESPTARRSIFSKPASPPTTPGSSVPAPTVPEVPATSAAPAGAVQAPQKVLIVNGDVLVAGPTPMRGECTLVPIAKPERPTTSVIPPQPVAGAPPWAHPGCRACKGTGMHPVKKVPCAGCRTTMMILKKPTDEAFTITYNPDGSWEWKVKQGTFTSPTVAELSGSGPAIAPVTAPQAGITPVIEDPAAVAPKVRKPRAKKQPEVALDVAPGTTKEDVVRQINATWPKDPEAKYETPPMAGTTPVAADCVVENIPAPDLPLILLCGSFPEKVPGMLKVASMSDIFAEAARLVGIASGKDFWFLNAFERRDALVRMACDIAKRLGGTVVVAPRSGPDQMALVEALKPFATFVIYGPSN